MSTGPEGGVMAKAKGRPKSASRIYSTTKIDRRVLGMAKQLAIYRGMTVGELISEMLEKPMEKAYVQMVRDQEAK